MSSDIVYLQTFLEASKSTPDAAGDALEALRGEFSVNDAPRSAIWRALCQVLAPFLDRTAYDDERSTYDDDEDPFSMDDKLPMSSQAANLLLEGLPGMLDGDTPVETLGLCLKSVAMLLDFCSDAMEAGLEDFSKEDVALGVAVPCILAVQGYLAVRHTSSEAAPGGARLDHAVQKALKVVQEAPADTGPLWQGFCELVSVMITRPALLEKVLDDVLDILQTLPSKGPDSRLGFLVFDILLKSDQLGGEALKKVGERLLPLIVQSGVLGTIEDPIAEIAETRLILQLVERVRVRAIVEAGFDLRPLARRVGVVDALGAALGALDSALAREGASTQALEQAQQTAEQMFEILFLWVDIGKAFQLFLERGFDDTGVPEIGLEVHPSSIEGAGSGLFVSGRCRAGAILALYQGRLHDPGLAEEWWSKVDPGSEAASYTAKYRDGSLIEGSTAAREAISGSAEGSSIPFAGMVNHPPEGLQPNSVFYEMNCQNLSDEELQSIPVRRFCPENAEDAAKYDDPGLYRPLRKDDHLLFVVSLRPLEEEEVFVDYAAVGKLPVWYKGVKGPLAGRKLVA